MKRTFVAILLLAIMILSISTSAFASGLETIFFECEEAHDHTTSHALEETVYSDIAPRGICFHYDTYQSTYTMHSTINGQCYYVVFVYTYCAICKATLGSTKTETKCYVH